MTRRGVIGFLAGGVAAGSMLGACGSAPSMPDYRYRLKVEIETPQGLRTGSSVIEVSNHLERSINGGGYSFIYKARGEAVAVDLPGGRTLFALLRGDDLSNVDWAARIVYDLTPLVVPETSDEYASERVQRLKNAVANREPVTLPRSMPFWGNAEAPSAYPLLATFRDIRDPASVERVDSADLAATFGPGVVLRRITVTITDDPVTTGIEKRFGWWDQYENLQLDGQRYNNSQALSNNLNRMVFVSGRKL